MIALPVADAGMVVRPVAREELVYLSADPRRTAAPVTARQLADAELVLPETTWRTEDSARTALTSLVQRSGWTLRTRIEVEDVETAVELVGRGVADSVLQLGVVTELAPRLAPGATWVSLRPRLYDTLAIVHRRDAVLSPATALMIDLAVRRIREVTETVGR